ncbi:LysR family transcriptional regulator [Bradyrhizobium sp. U87765 SZCCT0131]|uniref:LysR family transcriptional regulator n=1 Tax=unclassified Bradyrhizobium TaxID=2631580 RepID=UPI001BABA83B|nr:MULTISPECIES: LysR family transcriptional regulator [unclassified Bradyrhizobium]MBR1217600.1 LysR family transcriptional regulator [Bradyrhizobium sp. U87765 SZCCT0131]MBR1264802.1 LysR family transcriptional regulator [Bradyrhizobium sp. U87765 SZCCT0134]MBR1304784.1 LysR family transcriptional regulator [Bradyrhizobium sp. U87765 SZCCT0110]MBR1320571.1 LysR family transcriptional regulator [Bradyrhizobium sp. U87765 SZCCT0109]MBR1348991.1 LysR family transcriptional regulator [Bradyrhizo
MDRIEAMEAFVAVADLKGFAPAARKLRLSPSAVTRLVAALEERVGARLLQRTTRSVALTDIGEHYLVRARRILADVEEAEGAARADRTRPSGHLVVSAPLMFGRLHVNPLMSEYLRRYPDVTGELRLSDRTVNLIDEGVDAAVRIGHLPDSSVVAKNVGDMDRLVVASPDYLARRGEPAVPADIRSHDIIHCSAVLPSNEWRFHQDGQQIRIATTPRYITNSAEAGVWHAEQGGGLTMVLAYQAQESIRDGRLRTVLRAFEPPARPIHVVYPASRLLSAKVRAFVDLIVATCDWRFGGR